MYKLTAKESIIKATSNMFRIYILSEFDRAKIDEIGYDEVQMFTIKKSKEYKKEQTKILGFQDIVFAKLRGGYINQTTPLKRLNEVVKKKT